MFWNGHPAVKGYSKHHSLQFTIIQSMEMFVTIKTEKKESFENLEKIQRNPVYVKNYLV